MSIEDALTNIHMRSQMHLLTSLSPSPPSCADEKARDYASELTVWQNYQCTTSIAPPSDSQYHSTV